MRDLLKNRITTIWLFLAMLTCISWLLADNFSVHINGTHRWITATLILLAFFKVRLVIIHFMELGLAPISLRCLFEVWGVVVCISVLVLYYRILI